MNVYQGGNIMTIVYFVRHAEPNYLNRNDYERELTEKGMADRELVTQYFLFYRKFHFQSSEIQKYHYLQHDL